MAQATSPSTILNDGKTANHLKHTSIKSDADVPIDPSIAASSPTYPPPYSPYQPQGHHEMAQYQGHPPPQMYRPEWSHGGYPQHQHGLPGPYSSPATTVGSASPASTAGPRPGQVRSSWFLAHGRKICAVQVNFHCRIGPDGIQSRILSAPQRKQCAPNHRFVTFITDCDLRPTGLFVRTYSRSPTA